MSDFRQAAREYIARLVEDPSVKPVSSFETKLVEFGSFLNWGTVGDREALYFRETLTKKKRVIVDGQGVSNDVFEEASIKEFKPYPVDFYDFFDTKIGGVDTGMIVVLSRGTLDGRPAVHAVNVEYDQQYVWVPGSDWPMEFKVDSRGLDGNYVAETFSNRFTKWVSNKVKKI